MKDKNHDEIAAYLKSRGSTWMDTWQYAGCGFDGIGVYLGYMYVAEIKNPAKSPAQKALTPAEQKAREILGCRYYVLETTEDCDAMLGEMRGVA